MAKYFPSEDILSGEWSNNVLWVELTPKRMVEQNVQNSTTLQLQSGVAPGAEVYNFLAPEEFQETLNHTWEPLENIKSKISNTIAGTQQSLEQGINVYKVDTPLLFKDSDRRNTSMVFRLVANGKKNVKEQVVDPVQNIMKWASPQLGQSISSSNVELPYVFQIRTKRGIGGYNNVFNIRVAAVTSIQPSYFEPYIQGYPCRCDLTLTFTDVEPLSRDRSFGFNRNVTVSEG